MDSTPNPIVSAVKSLRVQADALLQSIQTMPIIKGILPPDLHPNDTVEQEDLRRRASSEAVNKIIECKMWLGKILEGMGTPFPANLADKAPSAIPPTGNSSGVGTPTA